MREVPLGHDLTPPCSLCVWSRVRVCPPWSFLIPAAIPCPVHASALPRNAAISSTHIILRNAVDRIRSPYIPAPVSLLPCYYSISNPRAELSGIIALLSCYVCLCIFEGFIPTSMYLPFAFVRCLELGSGRPP